MSTNHPPRPECACHGEPMTRRNDRSSSYRCSVRHSEAQARYVARLRAEGRCVRCGKPPSNGRTLREGSGICRPCGDRKGRAEDRRRRARRMAANAELFEAGLAALRSSDPLDLDLWLEEVGS